MRVVVIEPPAPILTWDEVKGYTRQEDDDAARDHVMSLALAATAHIDGPAGWLGRSIGKQVLEAQFDVLEAGRDIRLPYPPVIEVLSAEWPSASGVTMSASGNDVDIADGRLIGQRPWEGMRVGGGPLRIRFRAGYEAPPVPVKVAIGLMVQRLYDGHDLKAAIEGGPAMLLQPLRIYE